MNLALKKILQAKENRAFLKNDLLINKTIILSFTLNIPGFPKSNPTINVFFTYVLNELKAYLLANRINIDLKSENNFIDDAGNYYLAQIKNCKKSASQIKLLTEIFEKQHKLGRLIDVDITDKNGNYISSKKLKACFYCNEKPAIICMHEKSHSYKELRNFIFKKINSYIIIEKNKNLAQKLSSIALKSILYEVSLSPKPGLVDFLSSGAHKDMNYYTFLNSSSALAPFFLEFAKKGFLFNEELSQALPIIRVIGLNAENAMFKATKKINTQKGIIFLMGISLFASAYTIKKNTIFNLDYFKNTVKEICLNLVHNELSDSNLEVTHGELSYKKFGIKGAGARYEAEQGFPTIINNSLQVLENNFNENLFLEKEKINYALKKTLLKIISVNNDSNILFRKGIKTLEILKEKAKIAFKDDKKYKELCEFCLNENISPGGSADLLAVTIFIYFVKEIKYEL